LESPDWVGVDKVIVDHVVAERDQEELFDKAFSEQSAETIVDFIYWLIPAVLPVRPRRSATRD
jgi:hypothetical protein